MISKKDLTKALDKAQTEDSELREANEKALDLSWSDGAWDDAIEMDGYAIIEKDGMITGKQIVHEPLNFAGEE